MSPPPTSQSDQRKLTRPEAVVGVRGLKVCVHPYFCMLLGCGREMRALQNVQSQPAYKGLEEAKIGICEFKTPLN